MNKLMRSTALAVCSLALLGGCSSLQEDRSSPIERAAMVAEYERDLAAIAHLQDRPSTYSMMRHIVDLSWEQRFREISQP